MMRSPNRWFVYILRLADDTLYTGMTNNLRGRFLMHACGRGAKYVRRKNKIPFRMFVVGEFDDPVSAREFERIVKKRSSTSRMRLIRDNLNGEFELDREAQIKLLEKDMKIDAVMIPQEEGRPHEVEDL